MIESYYLKNSPILTRTRTHFCLVFNCVLKKILEESNSICNKTFTTPLPLQGLIYFIFTF